MGSSHSGEGRYHFNDGFDNTTTVVIKKDGTGTLEYFPQQQEHSSTGHTGGGNIIDAELSVEEVTKFTEAWDSLIKEFGGNKDDDKRVMGRKTYSGPGRSFVSPYNSAFELSNLIDAVKQHGTARGDVDKLMGPAGPTGPPGAGPRCSGIATHANIQHNVCNRGPPPPEACRATNQNVNHPPPPPE
eukprot:TRINITY_DN67564_c2_g1_i1.p1 TRINITY_DN67564_c2_g1~~TRINITY_DN67564_c2_g1_i1.p1  ORF type:complete len:186 (-),score=23.21 TRINITY_DN67564_c2_g1_i1:175-732(-)